jgi:hypothetical protein
MVTRPGMVRLRIVSADFESVSHRRWSFVGVEEPGMQYFRVSVPSLAAILGPVNSSGYQADSSGDTKGPSHAGAVTATPMR